MGESTKYLISQDEINRIAAIASQEAVKFYREEQKKEEKRQYKSEDKVRRTKKILSSYRRMKTILSDETEFTEEEKIELRWKFVEDLMGTSKSFITKAELTVIDNEKKRQENLYCIHCIENAINLYRMECEKSTSEESKRRFRELYSMYIDEEELSVKEIAERENVSEKTVYKDLGIASSIITVYLLGM